MILFSKANKKGIAAIEIMVVIALLLAALTVAVPLFLQVQPVNRINITREKIRDIKFAIIGDRQKISEKARTSFGFVGDLGMVPNSLAELIVQGSYPQYHLDPLYPVWFGWHGPYLDNTMAGSDYTALLDAWGNPIIYDTSDWAASGIIRLRSAGPNHIDENGSGDDIFDTDNPDFTITRDEFSTYVSGLFRDREGNPIDETLVTVFFPNGTSTLASVEVTPAVTTQYDSLTDAVSPGTRRIPIGHRFFQTRDNGFLYLATLNGGQNSIVNFIGEEEEISGFEHDFSNKDDLTFIGGGAGAWKNDVNEDGDYLYYQGSAHEGDRVVAFGNAAWVDYSIETEVSISDERHAEGFGIDYRANYSGSPTLDSGYRFTYYPDGSSHFTIRRIPNDFVPAKPDYPGYGFGYFKFFISVQTNGSVITHTIRIEKRVGEVFVEQTTLSFDETLTADSSLSGLVGFMVFGHQDSVKIHHVIVTLL